MKSYQRLSMLHRCRSILLLVVLSGFVTNIQEPGAAAQESAPKLTEDRGVIWGPDGEKGHHHEVGFNGQEYFMIAQANAGNNEAAWGKVQCAVENPGDQLKVFTSPTLDRSDPLAWRPYGGSIESARITPCHGEFPLPTTWGVGSLWKYDGTWYLTVDAGHLYGLEPNRIAPEDSCDPPSQGSQQLPEGEEDPGEDHKGADGFKHYVYLITSQDGIHWDPITPERLIIDGSNIDVTVANRILYTTVIPTSHSRVGFFFWTREDCGMPARIGYGQIELNPPASDPNGVAVYILRDDGNYVLLPEDGKIDFDPMKLDLPFNPRPGDAYLTQGVQGRLLTHHDQTQTGLFSCSEEFLDRNGNPKIWQLNWTPFTLTSLADPKLVLEDDQLPDNQLYPILTESGIFNPRNAIFRDPDVFVDTDGRPYLFVSGDVDCSYVLNPKKKASEEIHLYALASPDLVTYTETFSRANESDLSASQLESQRPFEGHSHISWAAHNMQLYSQKARPKALDDNARADIAIDGIGALKATVEANMIAVAPNRTLYLGFPNKATGKFGAFGSTLWFQVDSGGSWAIKNRYGGTTYTLSTGTFPGWNATVRHHYKLVYQPGSPRSVSLYFENAATPVVANVPVPKPVNLSRAGFQFTRDVTANLGTFQADADNFVVSVER